MSLNPFSKPPASSGLFQEFLNMFRSPKTSTANDVLDFSFNNTTVLPPVPTPVATHRTSHRYIMTMQVTPKMAEEWLAKSGKQRAIDKNFVLFLSRQMKQGLWCPNGQAIAFDTNGKLIIGQHRLHAVVVSGCTVEMDVAFNVDPAAALTSNESRPGTGGQALAMQTDISNSTNVCAWINTLNTLMTGKSQKLSAAELKQIFLRHEPAIRWTNSVFGSSASRQHLRRAAVFGAILFAYPTAPRQVAEFVARLKDGQNLTSDSPIYVLRECPESRFDAVSDFEVSTMVLHCLMKHVQGKRIRSMRPNLEALAFFTRSYRMAA